MLHETRVNLLRLLEDIRDSYAAPLEEVIITELTANALDSGASAIALTVDPEQQCIRIVDDGCGMRREELKEYHNIAATAKMKGRGIGFAGIGAKLALLAAERVITETKGRHGTRSATEWRLTHPFRAPWKFIPFNGTVKTPRGTAVSISLHNRNSPLLDSSFVVRTICKHFLPLLNPFLYEKLHRFVYRKAIHFSVNGEEVVKQHVDDPAAGTYFSVSLGRKNRLPAGFGHLEKHQEPETHPPSLELSPRLPRRLYAGLAVSTYGKIIKSGWEWLGILPRSYERISGVVEIPGLAEILTTNKADFLSDATSLKKYYRYRKAIQKAVLPILQEWGEERTPSESFVKRPRTLEREIKEVLGSMLADFPELSPLVRIRYREAGGKEKRTDPSREEYLTGVGKERKPDGREEELPQREQANADKEIVGEGELQGRTREPGLKITFEEGASEETLARLVEDTVFINARHPAWEKSRRDGAEGYHIITATAVALSSFLEESRSAQTFVARFLAAWGKGKNPPRLF